MLNVYVISLQTDFGKRQLIQSKLDNLQIPFEFIDAIYGKELPDAFFSKLNPQGKSIATGEPPTLGEVGCTLSHLKSYELILQRKQSWACILEDDVIIDGRLQDFYKHFDDVVNQLDRKSLYLMGGQNGISAKKLIAKSFFSSIIVGEQVFTKLIKSESYVCRTCCYLMSDKIAKEILKLSKTVFLLADDWEYLVRNDIIKDIYLSDFIDHPLDLTCSTIEKERLDVKIRVRASIKRSFLNRFLRYGVYKVRFYARLFVAQLYRFKR